MQDTGALAHWPMLLFRAGPTGRASTQRGGKQNAAYFCVEWERL